jgi:hypothetical protein
MGGMHEVAFVLPKPSHISAIATECVHEDDDFHIIGAQSCICRSSFTQNGCAAFASSVPSGIRSMKRMTFALSVPSHVYASIHLLERMCHLRLVSAQRCSINEDDDFCLVGVQSCVAAWSSSS